MNVQIVGPYCPLTSYLRGKLTSEWVLAEDTDVRATFARVRSERPFIADAYADVDRDDHLAFVGGFR